MLVYKKSTDSKAYTLFHTLQPAKIRKTGHKRNRLFHP